MAPGPKLDIVGPSGATDSYDVLALTHWHSPSEHTVDGEHYDLELHFGMAKQICFSDPTSPDCTFGVLGLFFDTEAGGDTNDNFIDNYLLAFDTRDVGDTRPGINLDLLASSVDLSEFWAYSGSTTSPPCAEIIQWAIPKKVRPVSTAQLAKFKDKLKADPSAIGNVDAGAGNNRAVQPTNGRPIFSKGFGVAKTTAAATGGTNASSSKKNDDLATTLLTTSSTIAAISLLAVAF